MKTLSIIIVFLTLHFLCINSYGQTKPLSVGDQMPDVTISNVLNSKTPSLKVSDFKGKLVIIDFWATWCAPCVGMLPKIDSLQNEFNGQVQFIAVSRENRKTVADFLEKLSTIKHISGSSVFGDTLLNSMFIHHYIPYYAWIDKTGKIIATTEASQVTSQNIRHALADSYSGIKNSIGKKMAKVNTKMPFFAISSRLLIPGKDSTTYTEPVADSNIFYQSILTGYNPDLGGGSFQDAKHFAGYNEPIINLYQDCFGLIYGKFPYLFSSKARYKIEVKDTALYNKITSPLKGDPFVAWLKTNGYCYELIWKKGKTHQERYDFFRDDLDRYFGKPLKISADLEKRMAPADILAMEDSTRLKTTGGASYEKHDAFSYVQHNMPLSRFMGTIAYFWQGSDRAIFDETTFKGNVDLELNCKMTDEAALNTELAKYGLKFVTGDRMTDVLIIKDR